MLLKKLITIATLTASLTSFATINVQKEHCGYVTQIYSASKGYVTQIGSVQGHRREKHGVIFLNENGTSTSRPFDKESFKDSSLFEIANLYALKSLGNDNIQLCLTKVSKLSRSGTTKSLGYVKVRIYNSFKN